MSASLPQSKTKRRKFGSGKKNRGLSGEPLESRLMMAADLSIFHNFWRPNDVNVDGRVSPQDALVAINGLNRGVTLAGLLASGSKSGAEAESVDLPKYDTNGDGHFTPMDALSVINSLNAEGENHQNVMEYIVRTFNADGTQQISSIGVGQQFQLRVFVHDLRNLPKLPNGREQGGVFAAYTDVLFNPALVSPVGQIQHNLTPYGESPSGTIANGVIDGAGSFTSSLTPLGNNEFLLWSLTMTANAEGTVTFDGQPTTDPQDPGDANQSPSLDTGIYSQDRPVCPSAAQGGCEGDMVHVDATLNIVSDIVANPDTFTVNEDAPAAPLNVLANDQVFNPPNGTPVITAVTQGSGGGTVVDNDTNVTYTPAANFNGQETFTYTISNGQGATATGTVTVNVTAVNDAPVVTVPAAQTINEDASLVFSTASGRAISVSDADGNVAMQVTIATANGQLTVPAANGVTITGDNTGNLVLTGEVNAINAALGAGGLTFQPTSNFNGNANITVTANDQGNTGGNALTDTKTIGVTINSVNDPPVNTVPAADVIIVENETGGLAISIADADAGDANMNVQITATQGFGTLNLASTTGLTVTGNGTNSLNITGPRAAINTALAGLTFDSNGALGTVQVSVVTSDQGATGGAAQTDTDNFNIQVVPASRPRAIPETVSVTEGTAAGIVIDVLANDLANTGSEVTLVSFTQPANGTVTRNENGTPADTTDDTLTFVAPAEFFGTATFTYTVNDTSNEPGKQPSTATVTVNVTAVNDAPTNTVPGAQSGTEDTPLVINGLQVADIDAGTSDVEYRLTVTQGTLNVTAGAATATGNGTSAVTLTGTIAEINAALATGVTYTPSANASGSDNLVVVINDLGNTGTPGPLSDTDTVAITIAAQNDAPVNNLPTIDEAQANTDEVISGISITDVDAGSANIETTLSVVNGRLTVGTSGVTVQNNGTSSVKITGSLAAVNAVLAAGVTYRSNQDFEGQETLTMTTSDLGNTGAGGVKTDTDSTTFGVSVFTPSNIGGSVFIDVDQDGIRDPNELGLEGVKITLTGTDFQNQAVNLTAFTDRLGAYSFPNLKPGSYVLVETQPAGMMDGVESFSNGAIADGNDRATINIGSDGGVQSLANLFAEIGLQANYARSAFDLLASSDNPSAGIGLIFGMDSNGSWTVFRGDEWAGFTNARLTINSIFTANDRRHASVTLTVRNGSGIDQSVTLNSSTNPRLIFTEHNGTQVFGFRGRPSDLFTVAAAEGEQSAQSYAQGVDAIMAEGDVEYA